MPIFSQREGYSQPVAIQFREELPAKFRRPIVDLAVRRLGSKVLRQLIDRLRDPYGIEPWKPSTDGSIAVLFGGDADLLAAREMIDSMRWYQVYDAAETIRRYLAKQDTGPGIPVEGDSRALSFERDLNAYFRAVGIGWQMSQGLIIIYGGEAFESAVGTAIRVLASAKRPTAAGHLEFAVKALSNRPMPDTSGAVSHATNAVECVLGEITGEALTLGKYLERHPKLFHPALKKALDGVYGYASDAGARHGKEGVEPTGEEARFAVAICASVCTLLSNQTQQGTQ